MVCTRREDGEGGSKHCGSSTHDLSTRLGVYGADSVASWMDEQGTGWHHNVAPELTGR